VTIETLNILFDGHLSRHERNIMAAMEENSITEDVLTELIISGAVKILDFGQGQVHLERQVFSQEALNQLLETQNIEA